MTKYNLIYLQFNKGTNRLRDRFNDSIKYEPAMRETEKQ